MKNQYLMKLEELKYEFNSLMKKPVQKKAVRRLLRFQKAYLIYEEGSIYIRHPYNEELNQRYRYFGGFTFDKQKKMWEVKKYNDIELCRFLLSINEAAPEYDWVIKAGAYKKIEETLQDNEGKIKEHLSKIKLKREKTYDLQIPNFKAELYDYQKVGVKFLDLNNGVGMIGDEMGLGKTLQALGYTVLKNLKTVVVCPSFLKYNWKREIEKFTDKKTIILSQYKMEDINSIKYKRQFKKDMPDYVIINYEQLEKYEKFLKKLPFECVVIDESHYIKEQSSKRSKATFRLFKNIEKRILLSGTALKNRPMEFYNQLRFLKPEKFNKKDKFGLRYSDAKKNNFGRGFSYEGASHLRELNSNISSFYIRRKKSKVYKDLPDKVIETLDLEMSAREESTYKLLCNDFEHKFKKDSLKMQKSMIEVTRIKQYLSEIKINQVQHIVDRLLLESVGDKKIIIFSQFIKTQKLLKEKFGDSCSCIFGSYTAERKMKELDEFKENPNKNILVASTKAAGTGLNITEADTVIFCDLLWNPADHSQAEDRSHRIGQKNTVFIYYLNYVHTIEVMLWQILEHKKKIIDEVQDGKVQQIEKTEKQVFNDFLKNFLKKD